MGRKSKAQIEAEREAQERARREEAKKAAEEKKRYQDEAAKDVLNAMKTSSHFNETIERFAEKINFYLAGFNFNSEIYNGKTLSVTEMDAIYGPDRTAAYALTRSLSFLGIEASLIIDEKARKFKGVKIDGKEYLL